MGYLQTRAQESGFILDLSEFITSDKPDEDYVFASDYRLHDKFIPFSEREKVKNLRERTAPARILGELAVPQDLSVPRMESGVRIKPAQDMHVYVPQYYGAFLPLVEEAMRDVAVLYGRERLERASVLLAVKKSEVGADEAQRPEFSGWHDHYHNTRFRSDLIYSFHTTLPTQFREGGAVLQPPENTMLRFGAEEEHRSVKNTGGRSLPRLWGAIIIEETPIYRNQEVDNSAYVGRKSPLFETFKAAAHHVLARQDNFRRFDAPVVLAELPDALVHGA